jgi:hypothetical protein
MVIANQPTSGRPEMIQAWRPSGSTTVLWAQDMFTGVPLHLVRWGDQLYLPVEPGLRFGICVYNGARNWKAYPTYVEAANLWSGGPSRPDDCTPDHMWEICPSERMVFDALMNAHSQRGRPFVVADSGEGFGIGETTFGTDEYHGQFRVYERSERVDRPLYHAHCLLPSTRVGGSKGAMGAGGPELREENPVAIGAAADEYRGHIHTGRQYNRDAGLVAGLRLVFRRDMTEVLVVPRHARVDWNWTPPVSSWFMSWSPVRPVAPTAPQVPVAPEPHRPYCGNSGSPA